MEVLEILNMLNRIQIEDYGNLGKALCRYNSSTNGNELPSMFMELYSSLESAVHVNETEEVKGERLDNMVKMLTGQDLKEIRHLNNRLKHPDLNKDDTESYQEKHNNIQRHIVTLRHATQEIIKQKLNSI